MSIENWKNLKVFEQQLALNLNELNSYPQHWLDFIELLSNYTTDNYSLLDVGCGCGIYYYLCKKHLPAIAYTGIDYSSDAIQLAKKQWKYNKFFEYDFWSLTSQYISLFDIVHCGALFDVLPNADLAIEKLLSLKAKQIIIGRIKITNQDSHYTEYSAYNIISTYSYYHNDNKLKNLFNKYQYKVKQINNTLLLKIKN